MNQAAGLVARMQSLMALEPAAGAIEYKDHWFSWGDMAALTRRIDVLLHGAGQGDGAAVGMLLRNRPSHLCAALAVMLSRRCVLTINPFQPVDALVNNLDELRPATLVMDAQDWDRPQVQAAAAGALVILLEERDGGISANVAPGFERVSDNGHHTAMPGVGILMLSSGTTGAPKRIPLAFDSFEKAILGAAFYESGDASQELALKRSVALMTMPLVHIGGLWIAVLNLASGRPIVLFEKFDVAGFERALRRHRPKLVSLPPAAIRMIYDANLPSDAMSSLIALRAGSAPLDPDFAQAFEQRYGIPILDAYGATEFAGGVAGWTWPDFQQWGKVKRGSVGRANKGVQLRVVGADSGEPLPQGQVGLLEVNAPQLGQGAWVRTTDLAELDADGFLYIRGRADDAIIRGGFKILPATVADALRQHPSVFDACVVGMPDARLGAVPMAAVELRAGTPVPTEQELLSHLRRLLVSYQIPTRIAIVSELPRTPSMKISQPGVKALLQTLAGGEHAAA